MCEYVRMRNSDKDLWTSKNGEFVENINWSEWAFKNV